MAIRQFNKTKNIISLFIIFISITLFILVVINRQYVIDQIIVWQYKPTKEIVQLANNAGLNDTGKFYFYTGQPSLESAQNFNNLCKRAESTTSILGCYSNNRIYIYNVTDIRLDGVHEVTAAHETLHAIYQRLSVADKSKVNKLLESEYNKIKGNKDYSTRMEFYERTEPDQIYNELFSVVGTEIVDINPELESFYNKYFSNRQKVLDLNTKYLSVFNQLKSQAEIIRQEIDRLETVINQDTAQYNLDVEKLNIDIADFNNRANNGEFTSQYEFDKERSELVTRLNNLNITRNNINANIDERERLIVKYNSIVTDLEKLQNSLDSSLSPAPSI